PGGAPHPVVRLEGRSYIELADTRGLLDLNKDFTIEMWLRFPPAQGSSVNLAGDEAWHEMSPEIDVPHACGWGLRTQPVPAKGMPLDFTVGAESNNDPKLEWFSIHGEPANVSVGFHHLAVCRSGDRLLLFWGGRLHASGSCAGVRFLPAPTNLY